MEWTGRATRSAAAPAALPEQPHGTFADVTERAGLAGAEMYGMGVAVADYDNDGFRIF